VKELLDNVNGVLWLIDSVKARQILWVEESKYFELLEEAFFSISIVGGEIDFLFERLDGNLRLIDKT